MNTKQFFSVIFLLGIILNHGFAQVVDAELIHWNDFHSTNISYTPTYRNPHKIQVGGSAILAGYIDSLKNIYNDALVVNAGDDFQGSPISSITKGLSQILIMNKMNLDAFTLGNHEFDYGKDQLYNTLNKATFPVLSANIYDDHKASLFTKPFQVYKKGDVDIAVIGCVYENLKSSSIPKNVEGITILPPLPEIKKYVDEVKNKVDLIIVLSHSGFEEDSILAENLDEVDVIVGGHSHSWLKKPIVVNEIIIVQAGARGERLGFLKMKVDKKANKILSHNYDFIQTITTNIKPNQEIAALVDSMESELSDVMDEVIGTLEKDWIRNSHNVSNLGNWICDATKKKFDVDIVFHNGGGIRKNLIAGSIKTRDIWEISPFDNTIQIIEITGQQLLDILKYRLRNSSDFLQFSGLKISWDPATNNLVKVLIDGKPVDNAETYTVATNNYIMSHSKRFFNIENSDLEIKDTGKISRNILVEAVKKQKVISGELDERLIETRE